MSIELLSSHQSALYFSNGTRNYFTLCTDQPAVPFFWSGLCAFCFLLGLPASVTVLWELCLRHRQNISTNDFFVFNLTIIDLVFLTVLPFGVYNYMLLHNTEFEWFNNFTYSLTICGRPLSWLVSVEIIILLWFIPSSTWPTGKLPLSGR